VSPYKIEGSEHPLLHGVAGRFFVFDWMLADNFIGGLLQVHCLSQHVPGLTIGFVFGGWGAGIKDDASLAVDNFGGNDVPRVRGNYVTGYEVERSGSIGLMAAAHGAIVSARFFHQSGLYLHADEASCLAYDEVIAGQFSPGLAHGQTMLVGPRHENRLCPFAALFLVFDDFRVFASSWQT